MPAFHATLQFAQGNGGWEEQVYTLSDGLQSALAATLALAKARYSILASGVCLARVRVSQVGSPHLCLSAPVPGATLPFTPSVPVLCASLRLIGYPQHVHTRPYALRGLPDGSVSGDASSGRFHGALAGAIDRWLLMLCNGQWHMQVSEVVLQEVPLTGISQMAFVTRDIYGQPLDPTATDPDETVLVHETGQVLPDAELAQISGVQVLPNRQAARQAVNGIEDTGWPLWNLWVEPGTFGGAAQATLGSLRLMRRAYVPITDYRLDGVGVRKVGRPKHTCPPGLPAPGPVVSLLAPPVMVPSAPSTPPTPPPPPPPPTRLIKNAREMAEAIFESYVQANNPNGDLLAIAEITNPGTFGLLGGDRPAYLVLNSGWDRARSDNTAQMIALLELGLGRHDTITDEARAKIIEVVPAGSNIVMAGHSFGGMSNEWIALRSKLLPDHHVKLSITYGSACMIAFPINLTDTSFVRFAVSFDPVPYLSPLGYSGWPRIIGVFLTGPFSEGLNLMKNLAHLGSHIYLDDQFVGNEDPFTRHNIYPNLEDLESYSWRGVLEDDYPYLEIGPITRYSPRAVSAP